MTIQSILCIFGGSESELNAANTAFTLRESYGAHLRFLHISPDPTNASRYGYGEVTAFSALRDVIGKENEERMQKAKQHIISLAAHYNVSLESPAQPEHHSTACFAHLTGDPEVITAHEGRLCDLIVAGRTADNALYNAPLIAALFNSGHPVMVLPAKKTIAIPEDPKTVVILWKDSQEASRAIYNAMPFLEKAGKVFVLTADEQDVAAQTALKEYLHTHNIRAQVIAVAGNIAAGEALLTKAKELQAGLLVMGAYGHTRLREMMLGGVTNYMLENADIPLLLSH